MGVDLVGCTRKPALLAYNNLENGHPNKRLYTFGHGVGVREIVGVYGYYFHLPSTRSTLSRPTKRGEAAAGIPC